MQRSHTVRYTTIQPILRNRFYIGEIIVENGEWVKSNSHEPLVSEELFSRVQVKLAKKNKSRHYNVPLDYAFRDIFICVSCKRSYTPYPQKGILYCQLKCVVGCENTNKNFNIKKFLETQVKPLISNLVLTEQELHSLEVQLGNDIGEFEKNRIKSLQDKDRKKYKLRDDLLYLRENKISLLRVNTYTPETLAAEENKLEAQIESFKTDEQISDEAMKETLKDVWTISELLKDLVITWDYADLYEKQEFCKIIFSELSVLQNTLKYKVNLGFKPFETRFVFTSAGVSWITELHNYSNYIREVKISLQSLAVSYPTSVAFRS